MAVTDILGDLITLEDAAQLLPQKPHAMTLRRWAAKGFRGVKLKTYRVGVKLCTTRSDLDAFIAALNKEAS